MPNGNKTKWEITQDLVSHCSSLLKFNTKKVNGYDVKDSFFLDKSKRVKVHLLEEDMFNVQFETETVDEKYLIKLAEKLRPHLADKYQDFYKKYDELLDSDSKVALSSKGQKLIYQIAFNLDKIPELKSEMIQIGKLLEKDKDLFEHYNF